jgi:hypothetical protein
MALELHIKTHLSEGLASVVEEYQLYLTINDQTYRVGGIYKNYNECVKLANTFASAARDNAIYIKFNE